jgi:hypothetical protein
LNPACHDQVPILRSYTAILPESRQKLGIQAAKAHYWVVHDRDLIDRLAGSTGLTPAEAARVIDDVLAWYREPVDDYVRRRHAHYKLSGKRNAEIFALISRELPVRVVAAPSLSERQLRRIVYG